MLERLIKHEKGFIVKVTITYIYLNSIVSYLQYSYKLNSIVVNSVAYLYNSIDHVNDSLLLNSRALGLSMGPNSNAVIIILCVLFIFYKYNPISAKEVIFKYITLLFGLCSLLLSQSQTGFIASIAIIFCIYILRLIKNPFPSLFKLTLLLIIAVPLVFNSNIISKLEDKEGGLFYLSTLFEKGTERSSYQLRVEKREEMIEKALDLPGWALIGWGKEYFGNESSATDNEHLYIALVYGPLIWLVIVLTALTISLKSVINHLRTNDMSYLFLPSIMLCAVIFALPAAFVTYPQSLILSAVFLSNENE
nr:hypothetical protein [Vibrio splendidus]